MRSSKIELTDLWGVAGRLAARLRAIGIDTPLELKQADPRLIRERLGVVATRLALELRGVRCLDLERDNAGPQKHHGLALLRAAVDGARRNCAKRSHPTPRVRPKSFAGSIWRRRI